MERIFKVHTANAATPENETEDSFLATQHIRVRGHADCVSKTQEMSDTCYLDLEADSPWVTPYVALRNQYVDLLLSEPVDVASTRRWLGDNDGTKVRCLIDGDRLLGCLILYPSRDGEVAFFAADKGSGIGARLLCLIPDLAASMDLDSVWAWVRTDNRIAQKVFEKCGFYSVGIETRVYTGEQILGIRYVRHLGAVSIL